MNNLIETICKLWWIEAGVDLKNLHSKKSMLALERVLKNENFDDIVVDYVIETIVRTSPNFKSGDDVDTDVYVDDDETSVSALMDDDEMELESQLSEFIDEEDEEKSTEEEDEKQHAEDDIKTASLTAYEKEQMGNGIKEFCISIGSLISEASVYADKYPYGHKVMFGSVGEKSFKNTLEDGAPMIKMPAEKVAPTKNAIKVFHKNSGIEVYLKGVNGNVYHIKGAASTIAPWFKHYTGNDVFKLDTIHKETASLLGVYIDAESYLEKFNTSTDESLPSIVTDFKNEVAGVLTGQDWSSNNLISQLKNASVANVIQVCAIAAGMDRFCKTKNIKGWGIIHSKINDYYKSEMENPHTDTVGGKANTADCVIFDGDITSFLDNMKTQKIYYDSNGLCTLESGEKFYQVSLKQAEGGAQLGKITKDFSKKFGLLKNDDLINLLIHEDVEYEILDESLKDLFNKGKEFIRGVGKKIMSKLSEIGNLFKSIYNSNIKKLKSAQKKSEKEVDNFVMNLKVDSKYLNERKSTMNDYVIAISKDRNAFSKLHQFADNKLKVVIKNTKPAGLKSVGSDSIPKSKPSVNIVRKLIANSKAYDSINRMLSNTSGQVKSIDIIFNDMVSLEKEMFFGRTELPLVKVFGLKPDGSGTAWKFLKTGREFIQDRISSFTNMPDNVLIVNSQPQDGYMNVSVLMLSHLNAKTKEPSYNVVSMRTHSASSTTFVIEGRNVVPLSYVEKNLLNKE